MSKEIRSTPKHPRHEIGNNHKNPAGFRDHKARPSGSSMTADTGSLLQRMKDDQQPSTGNGKIIIASIVAAFIIYSVFYQG